MYSKIVKSNITEYHASQSLKVPTKFLLLKGQENCGRGAL